MTGAALSSFRLDIVSDTICPWCYVGKRRLAAALPILEAEGLTFDVTWRPFQLNPTAKFGSWEKSKAFDAQVTEAGASAGLVFRHDLMAKTPNTVASHALIRLAHETGGATMQDRVVEALFSAYFTQGLDVGDPAVLADLAEGAGIERSRASAFLSEPASFDAVILMKSWHMALGSMECPRSFSAETTCFRARSRPQSWCERCARRAQN